jgi:putative ABC transport system permease protein
MDWLTVVGVVGDVRHQALEREAGPDLYKPSLQLAWKQMHFLVRARGNAMALVPAIRREIATTAPEVGAFNFVALEQEVANSLWQSRLRGWLLGFFSLVALALAATGLYGAVAYGVAQRTREIGIRMALGANRAAVLRLVLGQGMRAVALGIGAGILGAFLVSRLLSASLFGVSANDLASYAGAALLLATTAALAALIPARRASFVNPMEALRTE